MRCSSLDPRRGVRRCYELFRGSVSSSPAQVRNVFHFVELPRVRGRFTAFGIKPVTARCSRTRSSREIASGRQGGTDRAGSKIWRMSIDEIEAEALKLEPSARARLAKKLLESLETLSDDENERLWAEEADRRDADWESKASSARSAADVLRDARAKLR